MHSSGLTAGLRFASDVAFRCTLLIIAMVVVASNMHAQDVQVTRADYDYLQHYSVMNVFDSVAVSYVVGEFRVGNSVAERRVHLDTLLRLDSMVVNTGGAGVQTTLAGRLRSEVVTLTPGDSTIRFHRELRARAVEPYGMRATAAWKFDDRSEYVVQIVRASDNVVLATIDSVGIDSTTTYSTQMTPLYGTAVAQWCRQVSVPNGTSGVPIYFRIEPRQYGTSVYGMTAGRSALRCSRSLMYGCNDLSQPWNEIAVMDSLRFSMIVHHKLNDLATTCAVAPFDYLELTKEQGDSLFKLLFVLDTSYYQANGSRRWFPVPCHMAKATTSRMLGTDHGIVIQHGTQAVRIRSDKGERRLLLSWYDSSGALVAEQASVNVATSLVTVPVPGHAAGPLYLQWYDVTSGAYGTFAAAGR